MVGIISGNTTYGPEFLAGVIRSLFMELSEADIRRVQDALQNLTGYDVTWVKGMVLRGKVEVIRDSVVLGTSVLVTVERVLGTAKEPLCVKFNDDKIVRCTLEDINKLAGTNLVISEVNMQGVEVIQTKIGRKVSPRGNVTRTIEQSTVLKPTQKKVNVTGDVGFKVGAKRRQSFKITKGKVKVSRAKFTKNNRSTKPF